MMFKAIIVVLTLSAFVAANPTSSSDQHESQLAKRQLTIPFLSLLGLPSISSLSIDDIIEFILELNLNALLNKVLEVIDEISSSIAKLCGTLTQVGASTATLSTQTLMQVSTILVAVLNGIFSTIDESLATFSSTGVCVDKVLISGGPSILSMVMNVLNPLLCSSTTALNDALPAIQNVLGTTLSILGTAIAFLEPFSIFTVLIPALKKINSALKCLID